MGSPTLEQENATLVAELVRAEAALADARRAAARSTALLAALPDSVFRLSRDGTFLDCHTVNQDMLLMPPDRFVGRTVDEVLPPELAARTHAVLGEVAGSGSVSKFEYTLPIQGSPRHYEARVVPFAPDEFLVVIRDETQQKHAETALAASQEKYRELVENLNEAVFAVGAEGTITYMSPQVRRITGWAPEEVVGESFARFIVPEDLPGLARSFEETIAGHLHPFEFRVTGKDGQVVHVLTSSHPVLVDGLIVGLSGVLTDVTDRTRAEQAARESEERYIQSQKMEAVGRLAGGVAHDFNNLLQAMLGVVHLARTAQSGSLDPHIADLELFIQRGAQLARQLLLFSRREPPRSRALDLNEVMRDAAELVRPLLRDNVAFQLNLADARLPVVADRGQLEQVVMNLVVNAVDAMPEGGRLTLRTGGATEAWFAIDDTGCGIDPAVRRHLFEPFFTTKPAGTGTGLGLSVVQGIVAQHRGHVEVTSEPGYGTSFRVVLPLEKTVAPETETSEALTPLEGGRGERVLLVEDNEDVRRLMASVLEQIGYRVTALDSGEAALGLPGDRPFDLLLTDLSLPGVSGAELGETLTRRWSGMRVIVMSGYAADDALRRPDGATPFRFLEKPVNFERLTREVRAALDGR